MQDLIYDIKMAFNSDFEALFKRKLKEIKFVVDVNKNIRDIMLELDIQQTLWEPSLTDMEWPERLFIVEDSEVTVLMKCPSSGHGSCKVQPSTSECGSALWFFCVFCGPRCELVCNYETLPLSNFRLK